MAYSMKVQGRFKNYLETERTVILPEDRTISKKKAPHLVRSMPSKTRMHLLSESFPPDALNAIKKDPYPGLSLVFFTSPNFRSRDGQQHRSDKYLRDYGPNLHVSTSPSCPSASSMGKRPISRAASKPVELPAHANRPISVSGRKQMSLFTNDQLDWFEWKMLECSDVWVDPLEKKKIMKGKPDASPFLDDAVLKELKEKQKTSRHQQHLKECAQMIETAAERRVQMAAIRDCGNKGKPYISQLSSKVVTRKELSQIVNAKPVRPGMVGGDTLLRRVLLMQQLRRTNLATVIPTCIADEALEAFLADKQLQLERPASNKDMFVQTKRWSIGRRHWTQVMSRLFPTLAAADLSTVWYMFDPEKSGSIQVIEWCLAFQFLRIDPIDASALGKYALAAMQAWQYQSPQELVCINKLEYQTVAQELVTTWRRRGYELEELTEALQMMQERGDWRRHGAEYDPSAYQISVGDFEEGLAQSPILKKAFVAHPRDNFFTKVLDIWTAYDTARREALKGRIGHIEGPEDEPDSHQSSSTGANKSISFEEGVNDEPSPRSRLAPRSQMSFTRAILGNLSLAPEI